MGKPVVARDLFLRGKRKPGVLIPLTQGAFATVDPADCPELCKHKWYLVRKRNKHREYVYAARNDRLPSGQPVTVFMHRQLAGLSPGSRVDVDHQNGDGLDNRRSNLRIATRSLNSANKEIQANKLSSRFKGVYRVRAGRWRAQIQDRVIGYFHNEQDAAEAYNRAATNQFHEFARHNDTGDWQHAAPELPLRNTKKRDMAFRNTECVLTSLHS